MRYDQIIGLNDWAQTILVGYHRSYTDHVTRTYVDGSTDENMVQSEPSGEVYMGMFETEYPPEKIYFAYGTGVYGVCAGRTMV